jgi:hypothetical protein
MSFPFRQASPRNSRTSRAPLSAIRVLAMNNPVTRAATKSGSPVQHFSPKLLCPEDL